MIAQKQMYVVLQIGRNLDKK